MQQRRLFSVFVLLISSLSAFSQHKSKVGLTGIADKASTGNFRAAFGISFERMVNEHNSAEIGIYYRTAIDDNLVVLAPVGANFVMSEQFFVLEKFISIPVLYNYRSKAVNISIGPSVDIYVGWKEQKYVTNPPSRWAASLQSYKFDKSLLWGAMAKISHSFVLNRKVVIEPFVYVNPVFTPYTLYSKSYSETRQYYGAAVTAKLIL